MTNQQLHDEAFRQMGAAPLEPGETQPIDRRRNNRGARGNRGGARPRKAKVLVIDGESRGVVYILSITPDAITLQSADK